jgi:ribosome-associated protein
VTDTIQQRVKAAVEAALDKKAFELDVLSVSKLTSIADYFVLCSGSNERQTKAIADAIEDRLREEHETRPLFIEGTNSGRWILMDYGDFIIHVFTDECRRFYSLERLWGDAPNSTAEFVPQAERERQSGR